MLRSLFWIVAVAFLISGNRDLTMDIDGSAVPVFGADNPALDTSDRVIDSVSRFYGFCERNEAICETGSVVAEFAIKAASTVAREAYALLEEKAESFDPEAVRTEFPETLDVEDEFDV